MSDDGIFRHAQDFSLALGGPLFQLLRRAHLADDALMLVRQRIIVASLLAWLPLLVLSALEGQVLGGGVTVPFLLDAEVHIRFLVALPLLIVLVYGVGVLIVWRYYVAIDASTWYATTSSEGDGLSLAGIWYGT